jgi:hypothetical protein
MDDQKWFNSVALAVAATLVVGVLLGLGLTLPGSDPAPPPAPVTGIVDHLYLTISFNPTTGMDQYFPANFSVPSHTPVIVTITNYDNGTNVVSPSDASVIGTVGGTELVTSSGSPSAVSMGNIPLDRIAHTFTILQGPYDLNAVIPASVNLSNPSTVQFEAFFNSTGQFDWNCMAPCDPGSMMTPGLMTGILTVA